MSKVTKQQIIDGLKSEILVAKVAHDIEVERLTVEVDRLLRDQQSLFKAIDPSYYRDEPMGVFRTDYTKKEPTVGDCIQCIGGMYKEIEVLNRQLNDISRDKRVEVMAEVKARIFNALDSDIGER